MLYNYLKISLAVLVRRKFLTFVNLFGAVLTLVDLLTSGPCDGFLTPP